MNDYDTIFSILHSVGFNSWISIEDGVNGMDELRESVSFLQREDRPATSPHRDPVPMQTSA